MAALDANTLVPPWFSSELSFLFHSSLYLYDLSFSGPFTGSSFIFYNEMFLQIFVLEFQPQSRKSTVYPIKKSLLFMLSSIQKDGRFNFFPLSALTVLKDFFF